MAYPEEVLYPMSPHDLGAKFVLDQFMDERVDISDWIDGDASEDSLQRHLAGIALHKRIESGLFRELTTRDDFIGGARLAITRLPVLIAQSEEYLKRSPRRQHQ